MRAPAKGLGYGVLFFRAIREGRDRFAARAWAVMEYDRLRGGTT